MKKHYYVYILESEPNKRYYVGATRNVEKRLNKHNRKEVLSTKSFVPWALKYQEKFSSLSLARKREQQIKNWKSRLAIERLIYGPIV
jgi:putative endonuclease